MSFLIEPDEAKFVNAGLLLGASGSYHKLRLFKVNLVIDHTTTFADLEAGVADFTGYADVVLTGGQVLVALDGTARAVTTFDAALFTKGGAVGNTIYGYWMETTGGALQFCEKFDSPIPLLIDGAFLQITAKITEKSQFQNE